MVCYRVLRSNGVESRWRLRNPGYGRELCDSTTKVICLRKGR
jgi:hypothetical protein